MKHFLPATASFSLVEVTLALGVAGFCLIALFGLLPIGVQTNQRAISQTAATAILSGVVSDLRATPKASTTSTQYGIALSNNSTTTLYFDGVGQFATTSGANSRYRLTVNIPTNPAGPNAATFAYLQVTWPVAVNPMATPGPSPSTPVPIPGGSTEMFAAFTRN